MSELRTISIDELVPDDKNANEGTKQGMELLLNSISEDGVGRGILVDKEGRVIAGNKTIEQAKEAGVTEVVLVPSDGSVVVATMREDISLDSRTGRRIALRDNRVSEVNLEWDGDVLHDLTSEFEIDLSEEINFQGWELQKLLPLPDVDLPQPPSATTETTTHYTSSLDKTTVTTESDPLDDIPTSQVAMVQLMLNTDTRPEFLANCRKLQEVWELPDVTSAVYQAVCDAIDSLPKD